MDLLVTVNTHSVSRELRGYKKQPVLQPEAAIYPQEAKKLLKDNNKARLYKGGL